MPRARMSPFASRKAPAAAAAAAVLIALSACASSSSSGSSGAASSSSPATVNVAVIQALTGPGAVDGQVNLEGSELAADNINAAGGIKSMGGAKIHIVSEDAGPTTDTAVAATQLALSKGNISIGMGAELSSQTLAMEPIWTRAKVPWIAGSVADAITAQGSMYTFRESASTATENQIIPNLLVQALKSAGSPATSVAFAADNTAAPTANIAGMKQSFPAAGAKVVFSQQWTPPLADPVGLAEKIKAANPDIVYTGATATDDIINMRKALVAVGVKALDFGTGVPNVSSAVLAGAGSAVNGYVAELPEAPVKAEAGIAAQFQAKFGTAFTGDAAYGYEEMYIAADALQAAKSASPQTVRNALANIDIQGNELPAPWVAGGRIKYNSVGQNIYASVFFAQWQNGKVVTVYPLSQATGTLQVGSGG
jgi:branched-chain amino acid transport system substrate-binding protein